MQTLSAILIQEKESGNMGEKLSKTLAQNKQVLEAQFGGTVDLYMKV